jgi:hypothetical protein
MVLELTLRSLGAGACGGIGGGSEDRNDEDEELFEDFH